MASAVEDLNNIEIYDDIILEDRRLREIVRLCKFLKNCEKDIENVPWGLIDIFEIMVRIEELQNYYTSDDEFYL